ncbi:hypothetical protein CMEL01_16771 [Colletotrichum melonis]|uniref:Uncharacterized protein n=1 Tax=Colletotrichum melonis TaxID=1209925 RepID=A0AAI9U3C3_9PEZI|nr:hypothetical protein CMEL01_16771 [Colletotrichum melonis]
MGQYRAETVSRVIITLLARPAVPSTELITRSDTLRRKCLVENDEYAQYVYTCEMADTLWKLATRSELHHAAVYLGLVPTLLHATSDIPYLGCVEILSDAGLIQAHTPMDEVALLTRYHIRKILLQVIRERQAELGQSLSAIPVSTSTKSSRSQTGYDGSFDTAEFKEAQGYAAGPSPPETPPEVVADVRGLIPSVSPS